MIAKVFDEVAHDRRGWLSMHMIEYAIPIIEAHWSPEIEATPGLVSGLCKCLAKSPADGYWGGANASLRRLTARLSPQSHDTAKTTYESLREWLANAPAAEVDRIVAHSHYAGASARSYLEKNLAELGDLVKKLAVAE